jgi:transposase
MPNPESCSIEELELAIRCCPDQKAAKRLNIIHLLLCGATFELAQKHACITERCLQLWIKCYNQRGVDGVTYKPRPGRPRKLSSTDVVEKILPLVDSPQLADQFHWTGVKLCGWLKNHRAIDLAYSTLLRYLHEQNYARRIPRPVPEPPDKEAWQAKRETFHQQLIQLTQDPKATLFFGDEAGFEGDPRPRQRWVKRGSRPTQGYFGGHIRQNIVGAVNPEDGQLVSLIVPHNDTETFQAFLDTMAQEVPAGEKDIYLILDNASWHKAKGLDWHHLKPIYLPPYSPDYNPIERLWQYLKGHYLAGYLTRSGEELCQKLFDSLRDMMKDTDKMKSVCTPKTL